MGVTRERNGRPIFLNKRVILYASPICSLRTGFLLIIYARYTAVKDISK